MAESIAEFIRRRHKEEQSASSAAAQTVLETVATKPDETAADLNLASEYGKTTGKPVPPLPLVQEHRSVFQQAIERDRNSKALATAPHLSEWLRNPENAAIAKDSVQELSWWEAAPNAAYRGGARMYQADRQLFANQAHQRSQDESRSFSEILSDEMAWRNSSGEVLGHEWLPSPADLFMAGTRYVQSRAAVAFGGDNAAAARAYQQQAGEVAKHIASVPMTPAATAFRDAIPEATGDIMGDLSAFFGAVAADPAGFSEFMAQVAIEATPMLAGGAVVGAATRSPSLAAAAMGVSSGFTEYGTAPVEFFQEKGLDVSTPEGAMKALGNPELMREAIERGVARGGVIGLLDTISGGVAGQVLARNPWANFGLQAILQSAFGGAGEAGAQVAAGQPLNVSEIAIEAMAEFVTAPGEVAAVGLGQYQENRRKARAAQERVAFFQQLSGQAANSKVRARMPDKFRDFLARATANGPVENLYIPADQFVTYFQSQGVDPFEIIEGLDGVTRDDLDTAMAGGGDLQIPTATYAAKIAGSEHDAFLIENMRFQPDEMTAREAAEFNERAPEMLQQAWEEAEAARIEADETRSYEQEIYDTMVSRLRSAGRSTDVATNEAMLYVANYRTAAEREGMGLDEYLQAYPLPQVAGDLPEGIQYRNVDELNRTLAEARKRRTVRDTRSSLLEWLHEYGGINDPGGELRARNADVIRRGRGKKTLRLERAGSGQGSMLGISEGGRSHSADEVARAAIEAGYMANDPIANEYRAALLEGREVPDVTAALWDAIDRELGGETQFADEADASVQEAEALDEIEAYLHSLGVSLDDDDATIRDALEGARQYGQTDPESPAFKRWFGDSAAVDADGKPLVLYHGSTGDIDAFDRTRANIESDLGGGFYFSNTLGDVGANYAGEGPDLTNKLQREAERIADEMDRDYSDPEVIAAARDRLGVQHEGATYPVYLSIQNPVRLGGDIPTFIEGGLTHNTDPYMDEAREELESDGGGSFDENDVLDRARELAEENGDDAIDGGVMGMIEAIREMADEFDGVDADRLLADLQEETYEGVDAATLIERMKASEGLIYAADLDTGDMASNEIIRRAFEAIGFDGFIDATVNQKFGSERRTGQSMEGMGAETVHYIAFRPEQIKSVNNRGTFDPNDPRILYQLDAYHGSPYLFRRFSWDAIGSGDGNQTFGYGFYFSKAGGIAEGYVTEGGHLYRVSINAEPEQLIDTSKPISEQSEAVKAALEKLGLSDAARINQIIPRTEEDAKRWAEAGIVGSQFRDVFTAQTEVEFDDDVPAGVQAAAEWAFANGADVDQARELLESVGVGPNGETDAADAISMIEAGKIRASEKFDTNYVIFDTDRIEITEQDGKPVADEERAEVLFQSIQDRGGPRGSIQAPAGGIYGAEAVIRLHEAANLSTFLHESGHLFLMQLQDQEGRGSASAQGLMSTVRDWWRDNAEAVAKDAARRDPAANVTAEDVIAALENGTAGDAAKDRAIDVGMQEQWARGFEAYLMEGKAPSIELRDAFERFRAWLVSVYRRLAGLNVELSDDIRSVFDRMLASDAEIEKAKQAVGGFEPSFPSAEAMGLSPDEYSAFLKLRSQAEDEAKARTLREIMAPVKREKEKWFKAERAKVREEVERDVNSFPVYRAIEWMGNKRWLGGDEPIYVEDARLSKSILVDRYGKGVLETLPRGKQTIYAVEGGVDPDDVAGWFGFSSGDEMIRALEKAPKRVDAIEQETDRVMRDRHGDALNDGSLELEAIEAVHSDKRGEWLAAELKAVVEVAGTGTGLTAKDARHSARQTLSRSRVRDAMASQRYLAAERKAGQEAARLGAMLAREKVWLDASKRRIANKARAAIRGNGKPDTAARAITDFNARVEAQAGSSVRSSYNDLVARLIDAKRRQLLNHALYQESRKVADEVAKAERFVAKLGKKSTRERIAGAGRRENAQIDYLAAIDELLERYDFRRMSGRAEDRRGSLNAFVEAMKAAGRENELAIPDAVLADAARKPYKAIPVDELRGVVESLKNLEHIASRWNKLIDAQGERDRDAAITDMLASFEANVKKKPVSRFKSGRAKDARRKGVRQYIDLVLNAGTILREIDGFEDLGAMYRNIKAPIDDAASRLLTRKEKAATDLEALYEVYTKEERRRMNVPEFMPELGQSLTKWERIAIALNTGNDGNFQRLTDDKAPGTFTEPQVQAVLATLDERDADFVQSVWDFVGSFRKDIEARERRATGTAPAWVEPSPVVIAGKTLTGGYYPLRYDGEISALARDDEHALQAQSLQGGRFGKAQTRNGHLKARAQSSGRGVDLDMSVLHSHVNQVIYDIELSEPVSNSWRLLQDGRIRSAFVEAGKQADFEALEIWLQDVGNGELRAGDWLNRASRILKSNFTAAKLALNVGTMLAQITGLAQTAVVVGKRDMMRGIQASLRPGVSDEIVAKSAFMKTRQTTFNKDLYDFYNDPKQGPVASEWRDLWGKIAFLPMTKIQWVLVDIPTWLAGYQQGLSKFKGDETKAIAHADAIVKRAQASGLFSDRAAIERGSISRTQRQSDVIRLFTTLGSYMFAKFNVAYERSAVARRTIGREGVNLRSAQEAMSWTVDMAFLFTLEAVMLSAIKGFALGGGDEEEEKGWAEFLAKETGLSILGTLPFVRDASSALQGYGGGGAYGSIIETATAPITQGMQGELDAALVKSVINATGLYTGLPATQINRVVDAGWRQVEGEEVAPMEYLLGRPR